MKKFFYILFFLSPAITFCQVEVNNSIIPAINDSLKIENTGISSDSTELVSLETARNNKLLFYTATNTGDTLYIQTDSALFRVHEGCILYVQSSMLNNGPVSLNVNGTDFDVVKNNGYTIDRGEIIPQKILVLTFSDTVFVLLNPERPLCPAGSVQVNDSYCIETNERQGNFWNAVGICANLGGRLCSWSEWYYACQKSSLGLNQMTNNWEWVNQGQNEPFQGKGVGNGKCNITTHQNLASNIFYRCCFSY